MTAIDQSALKKQEINRFFIIYNFLSIIFNIRTQLFIKIKENKFIISLINFFKSSSWLERELWDMYGICFSNNKDLRRLLTDYGFEGNPLKKDFPLTGFSEVFYSDSLKRVSYKPVELSQEFRLFNFRS